MNLDIDKERLEFLDFAPAPLPGYWCERQEREFAVWCAAKARATPLAPTPAAAEGQEPAAPHILEALSYHANERDDLTLEEAVEAFRYGWKKVRGRSEREMLAQLIYLMASAPAEVAAPLPRQAAVQSEWISVADRLPWPAPLPNGDTQVILALWKRGALADNLSSAMTSNVIYFMQNVANFTHWMPLPTAPQTAPDQAKSAPATTEKED